MKSTAFLSLFLALPAFGTVGTWDWTKASTPDGLTPENPADWSNPANWVDGIVPSGEDGIAFLVPSNQTTSLAGALHFIKVPDGGVSLGGYWSRRGAQLRIIGGPVTVKGTATAWKPDWTAPVIRDEVAGTTVCTSYYYSDLYFQSVVSVNRVNVCAPVRFTEGNTSGTLVVSDYYRHLANWYATSDAEEVTDEYFPGTYSPGSGGIFLYARAGADAQSGTWTTTAASPYLRRVGDKHDLAPGCHVHGEGIPEGAWLKRVFTDSLVEISAPCTATSGEAGVAVTFDAFAPTTVGHVKQFQCQGTGVVPIGLIKTREQDDMRLYVDYLYCNSRQYLKISSEETTTDFMLSTGKTRYPGTFIFKNATGHKDFPLTLGYSSVEFWPNGNSTTGRVPRVRVSGSARVNVSNDWTTAFSSLEELSGALTKTGGGELFLNAGNLTSASAAAWNELVCKEGTVSLSTAALGADDFTPALATLEFAAGATFRLLPASRLHVAAIKPAAGAKLVLDEGAVLTIAKDAALDGLVIEGTGGLAVDYGENERADAGMDAHLYPSQYAPAIKGTPAFWVDAAKLLAETPTGTVEAENGTNFVTRFDDCRGAAAGGVHFATNCYKRPWLVTAPSGFTGIQMTGDVASWNGGKAENCTPLVWDEPIKNIRTVFAVLDVTGGYGTILGATRRLPTAHYLRGSTDVTAYLVYRNGNDGACGSPYVANTNAQCFVNGVETVTLGKISGIVSKGVAVIEIGATGDTAADAFGLVDPSSAWSKRYDLCGREKILEYLVYTNDLSFADRYNTHAFLLEKYGLTNARITGVTDRRSRIDLFAADQTAGFPQTVEVGAGKALTAVSVSNGVDLVKAGAGSLYLLDCVDPAGSIAVRGGTLAVNAGDAMKQGMPSGAYLHLDADDASTLSTAVDAQGVTRVTAWKDPAEDGLTATLVASGSTNKPFLVANALNGRAVVDFGPAKGDGGSIKSKTSPSLKFTGVRDLRTVFTVLGTAGGGGTILGGEAGRNDALSYRISTKTYLGLWRDVQKSPTAYTMALINGSILGNYGNYLGTLQDMTKTEVRRNGEIVDQSKVGFTGGYDLISVIAPNDLMEANLVNGIHYGNQWGGQQVAELAYYQRVLRQDEFDAAQAYLFKKWYDRDSTYYRKAQAAKVEVAAGATLEVMGGGTLETAALAGAGTVKGNVELTAGVAFSVEVSAAGTISPLTVTGALALPETGSVTLTGNAEGLLPGTYALVSATTLSGDAAQWTLAPKCHRQQYVLYVADNTLYLRMTPPGTVLLVR